MDMEYGKPTSQEYNHTKVIMLWIRSAAMGSTHGTTAGVSREISKMTRKMDMVSFMKVIIIYTIKVFGKMDRKHKNN